jgi:hypothetical protein
VGRFTSLCRRAQRGDLSRVIEEKLGVIILRVLVVILHVRDPERLLAFALFALALSTATAKQQAWRDKRTKEDATGIRARVKGQRQEAGMIYRSRHDLHAKLCTSWGIAICPRQDYKATKNKTNAMDETGERKTYPDFQTVDGDKVFLAADHEGAKREVLPSLSHLGHLMCIHPVGLCSACELGMPAARTEHSKLASFLKGQIVHRTLPVTPVSTTLSRQITRHAPHATRHTPHATMPHHAHQALRARRCLVQARPET